MSSPQYPQCTSPPHPSPFLDPTSTADSNSLAILYLKRDLLLPIILQAHDPLHEGYSEGKVTNTRFGSYPHSTLLGNPWGSQVRASAVDTGSRGKKGRKRKRGANGEEGGGVVVDAEQDEEGMEQEPKEAVVASTGFAHLLPPTPEVWTASLPHRTQVVYTPDYSFILQRLRARPGTVLIEAGAGSGSFTHAAARAVFNGYPANGDFESDDRGGKQEERRGRVWSYEFHEQRMQKLKEEITEHGLDGIVTITHKDVCEDGFGLDQGTPSGVGANAVFLDLPAPWLALKHLTRTALESPNLSNRPPPSNETPLPDEPLPDQPLSDQPIPDQPLPDQPLPDQPFPDQPLPDQPLPDQPLPDQPPETPHQQNATQPQPLLDPKSSIHLCTFSPCIEQVQRTITTLRTMNWLDIEMVEIAAKRIEVRRERIGLHEEGLRGVNASPATVDEALTRLREVEGRSRIFHNNNINHNEVIAAEGATTTTTTTQPDLSKQQRIKKIKEAQDARKLYKEGRLVHKTEPDLKTHTSYLVFAVLPREWTEGDELKAQKRWAGKGVTAGAGATTGLGRESKKERGKQKKKEKEKGQRGGSRVCEKMG